MARLKVARQRGRYPRRGGELRLSVQPLGWPGRGRSMLTTIASWVLRATIMWTDSSALPSPPSGPRWEAQRRSRPDALRARRPGCLQPTTVRHRSGCRAQLGVAVMVPRGPAARRKDGQPHPNAFASHQARGDRLQASQAGGLRRAIVKIAVVTDADFCHAALPKFELGWSSSAARRYARGQENRRGPAGRRAGTGRRLPIPHGTGRRPARETCAPGCARAPADRAPIE